MAQAYDAPGGSFPSTDVAAANGGGANFFYPGRIEFSDSCQFYTPTAEELAMIEAGRLQATLAADLGGWSDQGDSGEAFLNFFGLGVERSDPVRIGPVTATDRDNKITLLRRSTSGIVPRGTATIETCITASRKGGSSNDGYVDNVSLELTEVSPAVGAGPTPPLRPRTRAASPTRRSRPTARRSSSRRG